MLNQRQIALNNFIEQQKQIPLINKFNNKGQQASWDDWGWKIKDVHGKSYNIYFTNPEKVKKSTMRADRLYEKDEILPSPWRELAMCYFLHHEARFVSIGMQTFRNISARWILSKLACDLTNLDQSTLKAFSQNWHSAKWMESCPDFFKWCRDLGIIRKSLKIPVVEERVERTYEAVQSSIDARMPDSRALRALASISHDLIVSPATPSTTDYFSKTRHEFVACMSTLGMASPNRINAEQTVLEKQRLKSDTTKIKQGDAWTEKTIYYLDWQGSKGFKDNRNHILSVMQKPVAKAMDFLCVVCEPARILSRFYESPTEPLKNLVGDYQMHPDNLKPFDMNKPVNMFQLGYILGFYNNAEQQIRLYESKYNLSSQLYKKYYKPVWQLQENDILRLSAKTITPLMGTFTNKLFPLKAMTVAEFQATWITYVKDAIPTFPWRIVGDNKVHLSQALFTFTGKQLATNGSSYKMGTSFYAIESFDLGRLFAKSINSRERHSAKNDISIFEAFGFSKDIRIHPNQLRHWLNHMGQASELSDEVVALWSGRKDINQNAVYDHIPNTDRVAQIGNVQGKLNEATDEEIKQKIRIVTAEDYQKATGKTATVTATGICTQELAVSPCTYLSDFMSHCALCSSSCHVNRDKKAIEILKKDYEVQQARLEQVSASDNFHVNTRQQDWFLIHHRNTSLLKQLIDLMESEQIVIGSPIRYVGREGVFRITDLAAKKVEEVKALLPNSKNEMQKLIENQSESEHKPLPNQALSNLLAEFGVGEVK